MSSSWIAKHPGGRDPLLQAEGTDCTVLFRSYHLMREPAAKALARYEVPIDAADPRHVEGVGSSHFTFAPGDFYREVQARARTYFERTGLYLLGLPLWALQDFARSVVSLFTGKHAGVGFSLAQRIENTLVGRCRASCARRAEFGLPYNTSRSLWEAMGKHYRVLQRNSTP